MNKNGKIFRRDHADPYSVNRLEQCSSSSSSSFVLCVTMVGICSSTFYNVIRLIALKYFNDRLGDMSVVKYLRPTRILQLYSNQKWFPIAWGEKTGKRAQHI